MNRFAACFAAALCCGLAWTQDDPYQRLPTYPGDTKIRSYSEGPAPGSKTGPTAPRYATYVWGEDHPPALQVLVRTNCGVNARREDLIGLAQSRRAGGRARVVDFGKVNGDRVQLWAVTVSRQWTRTFKLKSEDGKYIVQSHRVREKPIWRVSRLVSPVNFSTCHDESKLTVEKVWKMALSALDKAKRLNAVN